MNINAEVATYAAETDAMPSGHTKAVRMRAVTDARHFARTGQPDKARNAMINAMIEAAREN